MVARTAQSNTNAMFTASHSVRHQVFFHFTCSVIPKHLRWAYPADKSHNLRQIYLLIALAQLGLQSFIEVIVLFHLVRLLTFQLRAHFPSFHYPSVQSSPIIYPAVS
jgi:hypothetical protein